MHSLKLYERGTTIIRPGHSGRFTFLRTSGNRVVLQPLPRTGAAPIFVRCTVYEQQYAPARDAEAREVDRAALLKAIHQHTPYTAAAGDLHHLRKRGLVTHDTPPATTLKAERALEAVGAD